MTEFDQGPEPGDDGSDGSDGVSPHPPHPSRPPYRPPIGLPLEKQSKWAAPASLLFHALIIIAILVPSLLGKYIIEQAQGAGGPGPAGGGGGGRRGSGGAEHVVERIRYFQAAPPPAPVPQPTVTPPVVPPVTPPPEQKKPDATPTVDVKIEQPKVNIDVALTAGIGGGTGSDGSNGTGPGSGGGVGSGTGTGRGSSVGPGTGGGPGTIYPPAPDFILMPPIPTPQKVKGHLVVLKFTVSEKGEVLKLELEPGSGDRGYDRQIIEKFKDYKFRPATRWDGTPVQVVYPMSMQL